MLLFSNADCRSAVAAHRADAVSFATSTAICCSSCTGVGGGYGPVRPAALLARATGSTSRRPDHLPPGAHGRGADTADGAGHRRATRATARHARQDFPFDPSQATIPDPAPTTTTGRDTYEVRLVHRPIDGVGPTTRSTTPIRSTWRVGAATISRSPSTRGLRRGHLRQRAPAATVHLFMQATGGLRDGLPAQPAEGVPGTSAPPGLTATSSTSTITRFFHGGSLYGVPMPPG